MVDENCESITYFEIKICFYKTINIKYLLEKFN